MNTTKQTRATKMLAASLGPALCLLFMAFNDTQAQAQWTTNGNNISNTNSGNVGIGTTSPAYKLDVTTNFRLTSDGTSHMFNWYPAITSSGTNYYKAFDINAYQLPISSGVTESGYRIGLGVQGFVSDNNFAGTLGYQYGIWARHGSNVAASGSRINNSYGVYIDSMTTANTTIDNLFGLYQASASAKNYFGGNVGIGTSSPSANLHVESSSSPTIRLVSTGDNVAYQRIKGSTGDWYVGLFGSADYSIGDITNSNTTYLTVKRTSGNVGLGTTSPGQRLTVAGNASGFASAIFNSHANGSGLYLAAGSDSLSALTIANAAQTTGRHQFLSDGNASLALGGGNVGIGTTSAGYKLDVYGPAGNYPGRVGSPDGYLLFGPANNGWSHFTTDRPRFYFNTGITVDTGNIGSYSQDLNLQTSGTTRLTINNSTGNVGIGATSSSYKVDVNGELNATGLRVNGTPVSTVASQWASGTGAISYTAGKVGIGTATPEYKLDVSQNFRLASDGTSHIANSYPAITSSGTNYYKAFDINAYQLPISSGVTESGYRIGLGVQGFVSDNYFAGTLGYQYGIWARHGSNVAASGSRINNSYGVYIDSMTTANTTIDNLFGLYQASPVAKNYFGGNVGIGTTASDFKLQVLSGAGAQYIFAASQAGVSNGYTIISDGTNLTHQWYNGGGEAMRLNSNGNVGIGTASANFKLQVLSGGGAQNIFAASQAGVSNGYTIVSDGTNLTHQWYSGAGEAMRLNSNGNIGIGNPSPQYKLDVNGTAHVTGNMTVDGNISAKYQDVAEWVPASEQLSAGTVVVLDSTKSNQVTSSSVSYDTRVAGVISEQPGIALGEKGEDKVLVATTGRVRVKVDASKGPIHIGDLLVTSDVSGVAMKSEPVEVAGRKMHMPGTLIGKALEPLEKGKGEILVLLSLQ
jgi:hypothetical protein